MKSIQWSNFLKVSTWICCPQHYYSFLSYCLFPLGYSAVYLHCAIFMFFLCFCMSYAKIELFTQWNKNILNDFRPVFSVIVFLNVKERRIFQQMHTFCLSTKHNTRSYIRSANNVCMRAGHRWHAVGWCARNRLSERMSSVERRQSGLGTHTTGVHCICDHMTPIRQIRAQTDEALLNGSFY